MKSANMSVEYYAPKFRSSYTANILETKLVFTMLIEADWNNFRAKFSGREHTTFEWFCSLLFYKEHNHPFGALKYCNQPGIEAEPITIGNEVIGWQAKFIGSPLSKYKKELIEAINKAKSHHPELTKIYFYVNQDFGTNHKPNAGGPKYKTEIEVEAKAKGVAIKWKTKSFFESPFVCETNAGIAKHFFSHGKSELDFVQEIEKHTSLILTPIQSQISFQDNAIKINRQSILSRIESITSRPSFVVVTGEAGVGKTAIIKDLHAKVKDNIPFFVFKATEFDVLHINKLFKRYGEFKISDMVNLCKDNSTKYIVIDSAEKLSDLRQPEVFKQFLSELQPTGWTILFTTRLHYLDVLLRIFIEVYKSPFELIEIPCLTHQEIMDLSTKHNFSLPKKQHLFKLLKKPFYLNQYLRIEWKNSNEANYTEFREYIWKYRIMQSSYQKKNIHIKRENHVLMIARKSADSGSFFIPIKNHDEALKRLVDDEIIEFDSKAGGYFMTHDIYEEWALERLIERSFCKLKNYKRFYREIGNALAIRRAFQVWLSEKLTFNDADAKKLIESTVGNSDIPQHWQDEVIVAIMLSCNSDEFIKIFRNKLLKPLEKNTKKDTRSNANSLLHRILFVLRFACKEVDEKILDCLNTDYNRQYGSLDILAKPKGLGWSSVIQFINQHKEELKLSHVTNVVPVLYDWNRHHTHGETTKASAQISVYYCNKLAEDGNFPCGLRNEMDEQLIQIILDGSGEIKEEIRKIFDYATQRKRITRHDWQYELITTALSHYYESRIVATNLPKEVIALANIFWFSTSPMCTDWHQHYNGYDEIELNFGLVSKYLGLNFHPASAYQTPMLTLLSVSPLEAVNLILSITNRSIEIFARNLGKHEVTEAELTLDPSKPPLKQYICNRIWNIYRGTQISPALLQSIHMALEHWLLKSAKNMPQNEIVDWCLYLLGNSRSASISAVVVSVVLANPYKLLKVAMVLFRTKEFFFCELERKQSDLFARDQYRISYDPYGYLTEERLRTCEDKHREMSLEDLALYYQIFSNNTENYENASERQEIIWKIFDEHYAKLPEENRQTDQDRSWRLCLARMDRRGITISSEKIDNNKVLLSFTPEIDPKLQKHSGDTLAKMDEFGKYYSLKIWASYRWEGNTAEYSKYTEYDIDHNRVVADVKLVFEGLSNDETEGRMYTIVYFSTPPTACAVLLRDFADKLNVNERQFCKDILIKYSEAPFQDGYTYQYKDGVNAAVIALPLLLQYYPECLEKVKSILLFSLFDRHPTGISTQFSDYAVEAITHTLRKILPDDADSLFLAYLYLQPKYEQFCKLIVDKIRQNKVTQLEHFKVVQRFKLEQETEIKRVLNNKVAYGELSPIDSIEVDTLITAFQLLPSGTKIEYQKKFVVDLTSNLAQQGRQFAHRYRQNFRNTNLCTSFCKKFASFVLNAARTDIPLYVEPLVKNFRYLDYAEWIFLEFIVEENKLKQYDSFWFVWEKFYPCIVEYCQCSNNSYTPTVVHYYLFAHPYWKNETQGWSSIRQGEKEFFERVARDIGNHPSVLYSLAKLLNGVGSLFASDGILWISSIINNHRNLRDEKLENDTIYYIENLVHDYVLMNRKKVRTNTQMKSAVLIILEFLLEKGSTIAYSTRDCVL